MASLSSLVGSCAIAVDIARPRLLLPRRLARWTLDESDLSRSRVQQQQQRQPPLSPRVLDVLTCRCHPPLEHC